MRNIDDRDHLVEQLTSDAPPMNRWSHISVINKPTDKTSLGVWCHDTTHIPFRSERHKAQQCCCWNQIQGTCLRSKSQSLLLRSTRSNCNWLGCCWYWLAQSCSGLWSCLWPCQRISWPQFINAPDLFLLFFLLFLLLLYMEEHCQSFSGHQNPPPAPIHILLALSPQQRSLLLGTPSLFLY